MTTQAITMYRARCDAPGCETLSCDYENGNNQVYDTVDQLKRQFVDTREGSLSDEYGWLRVVENEGTLEPVEKHFCGDHTLWDDELDRRLPNPGAGREHVTDETVSAALRAVDSTNITESENA